MSESGLVRLNAIREEVKDSVESDPLRHDFVSITTQTIILESEL